MADIVTQRNIGAMVDVKRASDHATSTAAGAGDATTVTGITIDRESLTAGTMPNSALFSVLYEATLQSGKTISFGYAVQDSADNSVFADYATATYVVVDTGGSGGSTQKGDWNVQVNLTSARRYVRFNYNPKCSATGTDTTYTDAIGVLGGFDRLAAPQT